MWSVIRPVFLWGLTAATVGAELSFVASIRTRGDVDASALKFVPIPPARHGRHGSWPERGDSRAERDVISYSSNWCGASQHSSRSDGIASVFGVFTVPDLTLRPGLPAPQFASAWLGIDGAECNSTLLQAGVTNIVNSNGGQSASAWWEWYPEAAYTIEGLKVKPGDWISVNIATTSATNAKIVITNASLGYEVTLTLSNGPELCRVDAEWIIEDFYVSGEQVAFANFSDVWFMDSGATTAGGKHIGLDGAAMVHLQADDGTILCSAQPYDDANFVIVSRG
ncbi:protease [Achaetomium macrosporum]|uniref:Protease n=1 Tax=Achaetomium macrosporum TaxID=79813 RepID=A0AAN7HH95_9PEZI|nr:protease [Achaetomium macrosporum]